MNLEQLTKFIEDWFKKNIGASPEEFKAALKTFTEAEERATREEGRQTQENLRKNFAPGAWDPEDRSHPYVAMAGHIIRTDSIRVQRAGGSRDGTGKSTSTYATRGSGLRLARLLRAMRTAQMEGESVDTVLKTWGDDWMAKDLNEQREMVAGSVQKALGYSAVSTGGAMVPLAYMQEMIELLRARNVVRSAGARQMPMAKGTMILPRQTASSTSSYVGENTAVNASQPTTDQVTLVARKLMSIVAVSSELMRTADPSADQFVRDDLLMTAANREDLAFIRGNGALGTPTGLRYSALPANITASASGTTVATMLSDTEDLFVDLAGANVGLERPAFFMNPRSLYALMFARDATAGDGLILRQEISSGTLFGVPIFTTTQIPVNLGGGAESEMYLADMAHVIIGEALAPQVDIMDGAAYNNSAGTLVSAFSADQTVIRMKQEHDIKLRHPEAVAIKTAVDF